MLVAIFKKSVGARLALVVVSIVVLVISTIWNLVLAILLMGAGSMLEENPAAEYQFLAARLMMGGLFWLISTLVFSLIEMVVIWVYWKFYTNLRDRK